MTPSSGRSPGSSAAAALISADRLFADLDGRRVAVRESSCALSVLGVLDDQDGRRWVQVAVVGTGDRHMLTLRLERAAGAAEALSAIRTWLDAGRKGDAVLSVS